MNSRAFFALLLTAAVSLSCGDSPAEDKEEGNGTAGGSGPFLPWKEGYSWTYRVINNGVVSMKVVTIGAEEKIGGTGPHKDDMAFRVVTSKGDSDETISWQGVDGDRVLRYREQSFHAGTGALEQEEHWDPYKLHFDGTKEHTAEGATWLESYDETKIQPGESDKTAQARDRWTVDAPEVEVTVPAGKFKAVVVQKSGGSEQKTYWYVRGVGKVKETGGQTEELVEYKVAP